ncbi:hypothetical protein KEM55_007770 [Ascosphaera atra]|nr:hypothetical protein KEM55_007770 [Ascosphaera atra]
MIRQRVHYNGSIYPMEPEESMQALNLPATEMGRIQSTVAVNWLAAKRLWDSRFRNRRRKLQKQHVKELRMNVQLFDPSELPPACSAASRYGLPVPKLKVPRGGHILTVWASIGSKFDKKAIQRRRAHMKQLRVGTEVPRPEAGRRRSSTVISGLEGHRRSRASAYGIFPEGSGPARPARRPSSVAARGQSRGASPKRLASIDMGAAGAGATMSTAGVASVATGSTTSAMSMARRRESSIQPPALMQADNFVFANRLSPQQEVSEPTSSYPTSPGAQRRVPPSDAAIQGQQSPSPRESDVSPGSFSPRQLEEEEKVNAAREHYNSIRPPASPPQDDADQPRRSPGIDDESPNTPSDEYMRHHSQRFPNYASNAGEQRGYGEEGYGGYGAASPGRDAEREPSPFKVDETGIAIGGNGENTGTTSTRAIIDQSGVISPGKHDDDAPGGEQRRTSLGPAGYEPRESGSKLPPAGGIGSRLEPNYITRPEESPMIPPKAPTRATQARREAEARMPGAGKPSIVDQADQEATATKIKRDSGVGVKDPDDVSPSTDVPRSKSSREQAGLKERLGLD